MAEMIIIHHCLILSLNLDLSEFEAHVIPNPLYYLLLIYTVPVVCAVIYCLDSPSRTKALILIGSGSVDG